VIAALQQRERDLAQVRAGVGTGVWTPV
jgi:hypothetical protein